MKTIRRDYTRHLRMPGYCPRRWNRIRTWRLLKQKQCPHPPARYRSGQAVNEHGQRVLWVVCCACGKHLGEFPLPNMDTRPGAKRPRRVA